MEDMESSAYYHIAFPHRDVLADIEYMESMDDVPGPSDWGFEEFEL